MKTGNIAALAAAGAFGIASLTVAPARAQSSDIPQQVINNVIQNILQNVRDQIQGRNLRPVGTGRFQFSGEEYGRFDPNNPFYEDHPANPITALGYTKGGKSPIYTKAAPPVAAPLPAWLFGLNGVVSGDEARANAGIAGTVVVRSVAGAGAFDVTKIGIFTTTDALTFVATGTGVWSKATNLDIDTGAASGTLAYINGNFSTDFTATALWFSNSNAAAGLGIVAVPADSSGISYTGNVQYKFDLGGMWFIEPTVGVIYTELFANNFGAKTGDSTEVHGGARIGTEWVADSVRLQPTLSAIAFSVVDQSGAAVNLPGIGVVAAANNNNNDVGVRLSGKLNILWNPTFSTFIEAHGSTISGLDSYGGSGGIRFTW